MMSILAYYRRQRPITAASDDTYAAGTLPSGGRHAIKYQNIEIKFDLYHKIGQQVKNY